MKLCRMTAAAFLAIGLLPLGAQAANALSDEELGGVTGRGGIVLNAHLELNTRAASENRISLGFQVGGSTSYLLLHNLSGTLDLLGLTVQAVAGPAEVGDVIQLTLPSFLGFKDFGIKAIGVQSDPLAPIAASLGQIQLNGSVQMQGQVLLWAK